MSRMKLLLVVALAGCAERDVGPLEPPSENPPPPWGVPLSGGTMLVTRDGRHAVVADPDRDRIATVDLRSQQVVADLALRAGDEPGRLVEDNAGRIHIALRRGGALLTLASPTSTSGMVRRAVCNEPRGVAYQGATDQLHVACTSGELVSLPAAGGDATRRLQLDRDLRDVVVLGDQLMVTRFRSAELLTLDAGGAVVDRSIPPTVKRTPEPPFGLPPGTGSGDPNDLRINAVPSAAWRTIGLPDGRVLVAHQRQLQASLGISPGGYGRMCGGPVETAFTVMRPGQPPIVVDPFASGTLPLDVATNEGGDRVAVITAGDRTVTTVSASALVEASAESRDRCRPRRFLPPEAVSDGGLGAPTAIAFASDDSLVTYYPEVPALVVRPAQPNLPKVSITLPGGLGYDAGRELFHTETLAGLACASCHPEGRDDGLVWTFDGLGERRTQSLGGHVLRRAPYHWGADMANLDQLMTEVFAGRMQGGPITRSQRLSLGPWLDRIPAAAPGLVRDPEAAARGKQLFESAALACGTCHAGELLTNNQRMDVHTSGVFKVPSLLGVGARAPYMHDGCAATLADRFGPCGGGDAHGHTSTLTPAQLADLIGYLESL